VHCVCALRYKASKRRRQTSNGKRTRQVHRQRRCSLREKLAEGQRQRGQDKHQITRGPETSTRTRALLIKSKSWPKASFKEDKASIKWQESPRQVHRQGPCSLRKKAGRRPASNETRQASNDKRTSDNHFSIWAPLLNLVLFPPFPYCTFTISDPGGSRA
jgi:hypothetical protein